jgi:hypothetical protein
MARCPSLVWAWRSHRAKPDQERERRTSETGLRTTLRLVDGRRVPSPVRLASPEPSPNQRVEPESMNTLWSLGTAAQLSPKHRAG